MAWPDDNDHELLEVWLGEADGYFPATGTSEKPAAAAVDKWYANEVTYLMASWGCSSDYVRDSLAADKFFHYVWRKRTFGATSVSAADLSETYLEEPQFPSKRSMRLRDHELGQFSSSED